jgi:hypothetical protein
LNDGLCKKASAFLHKPSFNFSTLLWLNKRKNMSKSLPFLTLLIMLFQACSPDSSPTPTSDPKENQYYDLKSYFEEEVDRLNQSAPSVVKTVTLNDDKEQKETEIADFSKELLIFQRISHQQGLLVGQVCRRYFLLPEWPDQYNYIYSRGRGAKN